MSFLLVMTIMLSERVSLVKLFNENHRNAAVPLQKIRRLKISDHFFHKRPFLPQDLRRMFARLEKLDILKFMRVEDGNRFVQKSMKILPLVSLNSQWLMQQVVVLNKNMQWYDTLAFFIVLCGMHRKNGALFHLQNES